MECYALIRAAGGRNRKKTKSTLVIEETMSRKRKSHDIANYFERSSGAENSPWLQRQREIEQEREAEAAVAAILAGASSRDVHSSNNGREREYVGGILPPLHGDIEADEPKLKKPRGRPRGTVSRSPEEMQKLREEKAAKAREQQRKEDIFVATLKQQNYNIDDAIAQIRRDYADDFRDVTDLQLHRSLRYVRDTKYQMVPGLKGNSGRKAKQGQTRRGAPTMLGDELTAQIKEACKRIAESGCRPLTLEGYQAFIIGTIVQAGKGDVLCKDPKDPSDHGFKVSLSWIKQLFADMGVTYSLRKNAKNSQ